MTNQKIQTYIIKDHSEECTCAWCGAPLYEGDKVYVLSGDDHPTCCTFCTYSLQEHLTLRDIWNILDHKKG